MTTQELLSFGLAEELYALPIIQVREIIQLPPVTRLPGAPSFLRGVINLRGTVVPLVDLREELGLPPVEYGKYTVVIVTEALGIPVGLIVDRVVDVLSVGEGGIEPPPAQLGAGVKAEFITGLVRSGEQMLVLLELDRILTDHQVGILRASSAA